MKDLYRRNNLTSGETQATKIHGIEGGFEEDREAAFSILLNKERKVVYDITHKTLKAIGRLRTRNDLNTADWKKNNSDYVALVSEVPAKNRIKKDESVFQLSSDDQKNSEASNKINRGRRATENVNPLHNNFQDKDGALSNRNVKMTVLLQKLAWVCGASFFIVLLWLMFSENNTGVETELQEKENKYAVNRAVTAYVKPSVSETVVATLEKYEDVTVVPSRSQGDWDFVEVGENGAYILKEELALGKGEQKLIETCRAAGVTRPESGEMPLYRPTGIHKLILSNPPGKDTLLKMKTSQGKTTLVAYVRGGENYIIDNIAEGDYYFEFSIGENYGPACGRFLDEAYAVRDQEPKYFTATKEGFKQFPRTVSYVLKNELFNTKRIPMRHF
ncbi:MAG: hypothetical protein K6L75_10045 [Cellvibrionaceae bacterium]